VIVERSNTTNESFHGAAARGIRRGQPVHDLEFDTGWDVKTFGDKNVVRESARGAIISSLLTTPARSATGKRLSPIPCSTLRSSGR